jgi:hypothetical protein
MSPCHLLRGQGDDSHRTGGGRAGCPRDERRAVRRRSCRGLAGWPVAPNRRSTPPSAAPSITRSADLPMITIRLHVPRDTPSLARPTSGRWPSLGYLRFAVRIHSTLSFGPVSSCPGSPMMQLPPRIKASWLTGRHERGAIPVLLNIWHPQQEPVQSQSGESGPNLTTIRRRRVMYEEPSQQDFEPTSVGRNKACLLCSNAHTDDGSRQVDLELFDLLGRRGCKQPTPSIFTALVSQDVM